MVLDKNSQLITNICQVLIRCTDGVTDIPELQPIYHTPSKITYSRSGRRTDPGNLYSQNLLLSYPGLSQLDFLKFDELLRGVYQVYIKLDNGDYYEAASDSLPMQVETNYSFPEGHQLRFFSTAPFTLKYITTEIPGEIESQPLGVMFNYDFDFNLA